jgi:hypothetical protein
MLNALLATLLVFFGVGLLLYLLALLFNATRAVFGLSPLGSLLAVMERRSVERCLTRSRRGDVLRERGDLEGALREFHGAFFLYLVRDRQLASRVANHHTGLLSRLIAITEEVQGGTVRLFSLAKVDRLLSERSELQRRYFNRRASPKRESLREIEQQMDENRNELRAALEQLVGEIRSSRQPPHVH